MESEPDPVFESRMFRTTSTAIGVAACLLVAGCSTANYRWVDVTGQQRPILQLNAVEATCGQQAFQAQQNMEEQHQNDGCNTQGCMVAKFALYEDVYNTTYQQCMVSNGWQSVRGTSTQMAPAEGRDSENSLPGKRGDGKSPKNLNAFQAPDRYLMLMPKLPPENLSHAGGNVASTQTGMHADSSGQTATNSGSRESDFVPIGKSDIMQAFLIRSSIRPRGIWTNVRLMINYFSDYRPAQGFLMHRYRSAELFLEVNCADKIYSFDHETDYTEPNLRGDKVNDRHIFFQSNKKPRQGQVAGNAYAYICNAR